MITRLTQFSPDGKHRLMLWREWDMFNKNFVQFIGLNPSTANSNENDPTIRRCIDFSKRWGYGAMCMTNLFTIVSPDPSILDLNEECCLPKNPSLIVDVAAEASCTVACWGQFDIAKEIGACCRVLLASKEKKIFHLGLNNDGSPKHPLYLPKTKIPTLWL